MTTLPTLYKRTSTGALQEWTISFEGNWYAARFGQTGGKIQETAPTTCTGKQGRTNSEQAEFEARALWTRKKKKDYTEDPNVKVGDTSDLIKGGILPMLCHKFSDHGDKIKYPCFVQPKLDGHRCIATGNGCWSRTRKLITGVPHVYLEYCALNDGTVLDGELYNHAYRNEFERLTHFIRQKTPKPGCEIVQYHIYDAEMPGATFRERWNHLQAWQYNRFIYQGYDGPFKLVETCEVANEDELMLAFEDFLEQGYEGAIVRNADGLYANKRSYDLQKLKKFDDAEFTCIRVEEGKGKMAGHAVFVCTTRDGAEFKAKMKGDHATLAKHFEHPELVIGKEITVKYQGLTGKNKVPRFPVAWRIAQ